MVKLEDYTHQQLKKIASKYNKVVGLSKYSKLNKDELIQLLRNNENLTITEGGDKLKIKVNNKIKVTEEDFKRKPRAKKPEPPRPRVPKPRKPRPVVPPPPTPRPRVPRKPKPQPPTPPPRPEPKKEPKADKPRKDFYKIYTLEIQKTKNIKELDYVLSRINHYNKVFYFTMCEFTKLKELGEEHRKKLEAIPEPKPEEPNEMNINKFLKTKPSIKKLLEFLEKKQKKENKDFSDAFLISFLDYNERETIIMYLDKKGEKKFVEEWQDGSEIEKEILEIKLYKKYFKTPKPEEPKPKPKPKPEPEEPKPEEPKPEEPKPKPKPKPEEPKEETENDKLAKDFYTNINQYLRGSKRQINYLKKIHNMPMDLIDKVFENQANLDFFPTPDHCLNIFGWKETDDLLEGTAGLGSVIYYLRTNQPEMNITANELEPNFSKIIKKYNPSVPVNTGDFLKLKDTKKYDGIFLNPPFRKFGRVGKKFGGKGASQRFYMEFLFKSLTLLKDLGQGYQKTIYFISPDIVKSTGDKVMTEKDLYVEEFINNIIIGKDYLKEIFKKYYNINLTDKDIKELKEGETDIGNIDNFYDSPVSNIQQIQFLGKCKGFGGTNTIANMYEISVY